MAGPIRESSNAAEKIIEKSKRELAPPDVKFFETKFISQLVDFLALLKGHSHTLSGPLLEFYAKFTRREYIDDPEWFSTNDSVEVS